MNRNSIHLTYLYPDSFNLHGDRGNILAFERITQLMGADFYFHRVTSLSDAIDFDGTDILLVSPGELRTCEGIAETLIKQTASFEAYLQQDKIMLVIGTSIALFAQETIRRDNSIFAGAHLVNATCKERNITYSNDLVFTTDCCGESMEIVGGQIQIIDVSLNGETPLGTVSYGYGNSHHTDEGLIKNGFIFTNALGPVFVKNPWFAASLIRRALQTKGNDTDILREQFDLEHRSNEQIKQFIALKIKKYDKSRLE
jgi:CobQ-like glutamine amidotransferase family enzyme